MPSTRTEPMNSPSRAPGGATTPAHATATTADLVALVLMIVGGLDWGSIGLFQVDLVASLLGPMSTASRAVYALVGLASLYGIVTAIRLARRA